MLSLRYRYLIVISSYLIVIAVGFGIRELLDSLNQVKEIDEYKHMVEISQKKTDKVTEMKKSRDKARLALKRGRWEYEMCKQTELAKKYHSGDLQTECLDAVRKYGHRKMVGVISYLGPRTQLQWANA